MPGAARFICPPTKLARSSQGGSGGGCGGGGGGGGACAGTGHVTRTAVPLARSLVLSLYRSLACTAVKIKIKNVTPNVKKR
ncbi:unnamed protein product [Lampetra fluviatilis]